MDESVRFRLQEAIRGYLQHVVRDDHQDLGGTPERLVRAWDELTSGYQENPREMLTPSFGETGGYDEMVLERDIPIRTTCEHHLLPIDGVALFAYIPKGRVLGLSKIPRFIDVFCRRLQIQERLTCEIVDTFMDEVKPSGCALTIVARHFCMAARGLRLHEPLTETRALRGIMFHGEPRAEYMASVTSWRGKV